VRAVSIHRRELRSFQLQREASRLANEGHHELAVIVAQTYLELRVEIELNHLAERVEGGNLKSAVIDLMPSYNIGNGRIRKFFETALDVKLPEALPDDGWQRFMRHIERRNRVVHGAQRVSLDDARESITAVIQVGDVVRTLVYRDIGWDAILEEEERVEREEEGLLDGDEGW
jgi:hypothetical protein